ncbi:MAG: hypothetical protein HFI76_02250 [Lachnospiraceae bacterium]|nr:hypothetical protein [Lachnospiraceae bacterium]
MSEKKKNVLQMGGILVVILIICIGFNFKYEGRFLSVDNLNILISHAIIPTFVAWGLCFVMACDYTDMSIGSVLVLAANAAGALGSTQLGYGGVILGGICTGMLLMTLNFLIFVYTKIPSWIAGIGMAMIYEAAAIFYSNYQLSKGSTIAQLSSEMRRLGKPPFIYIIFALGLILAYLIYNRTEIGLNIRALGNGVKLSESMGIHTVKTIIMVGIICGFFVGCSAFLNESYNARVNAKTGLTSLAMIFQPMAAFMLAQVLQSKINIIIGVPICSLFVYGIFNMLTFMGVPSGTLQEAVLGLIVIVFGILAQRKETKVVK